MPRGRDAETLRLAELHALRPDELVAIAERATEARLRVGTPRERISDGESVDQRTVDLHEQVERARGAGLPQRPAAPGAFDL